MTNVLIFAIILSVVLFQQGLISTEDIDNEKFIEKILGKWYCVFAITHSALPDVSCQYVNITRTQKIDIFEIEMYQIENKTEKFYSGRAKMRDYMWYPANWTDVVDEKLVIEIKFFNNDNEMTLSGKDDREHRTVWSREPTISEESLKKYEELATEKFSRKIPHRQCPYNNLSPM